MIFHNGAGVDGQKHVPVYDLALFIHHADAVAVAVIGHPGVEFFFLDRGDEVGEVCGPPWGRVRGWGRCRPFRNKAGWSSMPSLCMMGRATGPAGAVAAVHARRRGRASFMFSAHIVRVGFDNLFFLHPALALGELALLDDVVQAPLSPGRRWWTCPPES